MGILLPDDAHWSPSNWVSRGLFEACLARGELTPTLTEGMRFCVDAQLDTLDLRHVGHDELAALRRAVSEVIDTSDAASFHLPEFHPVYLDKLKQLVVRLDGLLMSRRDTGSSGATASVNAEPAGERAFPIGETLDGGNYRITDSLFGLGADRVHLAMRVAEPSTRYLVSATQRPAPAKERLHDELGYAIPGVFELAYVGGLDERGDDIAARSLRREQTAVVERLPSGACVRHLIDGPLASRAAVGLAVGVGEILARAADGGRLLVAVRPESIWAERELDLVRVTGLSERGERLFASARGVCYTTAPTYERRYTAPELIHAQPPSDRTLSFLLAMLLAEWITGAHAFPDAWTLRDAQSIALGRHAPLDVPLAVRPLLTRSLRPEPRERPALGEFLAALAAIDPADLGPPTRP